MDFYMIGSLLKTFAVSSFLFIQVSYAQKNLLEDDNKGTTKLTQKRICGGSLSGRIGVFESPGFPKFYPGPLNCNWKIKAPKGYNQVNFIFIWFNTHAQREHRLKLRRIRCKYDFLEIRQEFDGKMESLHKYCGQKKSFRTQANSQVVDVIFKTRKWTKKPGFRLIYYVSRGCGGTLQGEKGVLHTPGYPIPYRPGIRCKWKILLPNNYSGIKLKILQFHLMGTFPYCRYDKMVIKDENSTTIGGYCGGKYPNELKVFGSAVTVLFKANRWRKGLEGFLVKWMAETKQKLPRMCGNINPNNRHTRQRRVVGGDDGDSKNRHTRQRRVVGGNDGDSKNWPWLVQVISVIYEDSNRKSVVKCGGTLIASQWIITAAHCIALSVPVKYYQVVFHGKQKNSVNIYKTTTVKSIYIYPGYRGGIYNDIALIQIKEDNPFHTQISPVCLPGLDANITIDKNTPCWISGWGRTSMHGVQANSFHSAPVKYKGNCIFGNSIICAGDPINNIGACEGDSGGPLVCQVKTGQFFLVGVLSHGPRNCASGNDYYMNPFYYRMWIENTLHKNDLM